MCPPFSFVIPAEEITTQEGQRHTPKPKADLEHVHRLRNVEDGGRFVHKARNAFSAFAAVKRVLVLRLDIVCSVRCGIVYRLPPT